MRVLSTFQTSKLLLPGSFHHYGRRTYPEICNTYMNAVGNALNQAGSFSKVNEEGNDHRRRKKRAAREICGDEKRSSEMCLAFWKKNCRLSSQGLPIFYEMKSHKASDEEPSDGSVVEGGYKEPTEYYEERATSGNATLDR
ncbi:hypothetical protein TNCT_320001 [Trichonephila clavata]|uniref:Uncharacterized protein n=1 Tax=Trichonephila clavata TaxID=2740835 RepID=A0A8X6KFT1_TRICU|nr:hypothetical protein TNCT_320001 [Trichonephila clavata]